MGTSIGIFSLKSYAFTKAFLDFTEISNSELNIDIDPSGVYNSNKGEYKLIFQVKINNGPSSKTIIDVRCEAILAFRNKLRFDEIPEYFYPNSLAILFPYVRAFISTLSLQANVSPIIIPTVNLSGLTETLKSRTSFQM